MQIPIEGTVDSVMDRLLSELKVTMGYVGARTVEMKEVAKVAVIQADRQRGASDR